MDITLQKTPLQKNIDVAMNDTSSPEIQLNRARTSIPPQPTQSPNPPQPTPVVQAPLGARPPDQTRTVSVPPAHPQPRPPPSRAPEAGFDMFQDIANQGRVEQEDSDGSAGYSDDGESMGSDDDMDDRPPMGDVNYHGQGGDDYPESEVAEYDRPSPGFATIEEERGSLLFKIHRGIRGGMPVEKPASDATIHELRTTVSRIEAEVALDRSIKFQRRMLCMLTSSIEWINGKYQWADLDGWSDSVATSISDYDDIFSELHEKYKGSMQMAPEIRLIMSLATSMFWFNLTRTMSKKLTDSMTGAGGTGGGAGGLDLSALLGSMMGGMKSPAPMTQGGIPTPPPQQTTPQPPQAAQGGGNPLGPVGKASEAVQRPTPAGMRKPMRGPDMGAMFGGAPPPTFEPNELPMMSPSRKRPLDAPMGAPPKRGRDQSDRLSDIVSDDSSDASSDAGSSGSSSGTSSGSDSDGSIRIDTRPVGGRGSRGGGRGSRGGRGRGRGSKNVISL